MLLPQWVYRSMTQTFRSRTQELCKSRGGRPGLPFLIIKLVVFVDVKQHSANLSEGADRVGGQLRGDKKGPFSGVTSSGRVWR